MTQIAVAPSNAQTAYVTFSGFSGFFGDTQGHVFQTTDGGNTWTDISGNPPNALPNIPANDIVIDPAASSTLYLATDAGVYFTTDGGNNWAPLSTGLPLTQVLALKVHAATRTLRAASFGRSAWDLPLGAAARPTLPRRRHLSALTTCEQRKFPLSWSLPGGMAGRMHGSGCFSWSQ